MPLNLDASTDFGAMVARRLDAEQIVWLTTVGADGTPQPNPVWFHWDGETFLVFNRPDAARLKHIAANPRVSLNFHTNAEGGDVVVFTGIARRADAQVPEARMRDFVAKYAEGIERLGMTAEQMFATYNAVLLIAPEKVRGF